MVACFPWGIKFQHNGQEYNDKNCHSQQKLLVYIWVTGTKTHRPVCAYESRQVSWGLYLQSDTYPSASITPSNRLISKLIHSKFSFYSQDYSSANLLLFSICSVSSTWLLTSLPLIINIHLPPSILMNSSTYGFHSLILGQWVYITKEEILTNMTWIMLSKCLDISILIALIG